MNFQATWPDFLSDLHDDILPIYRHHEETFDPHGTHGRMHICRTLVFAEFMLRYYHTRTALRPDVDAVRYAAAFHDSGRQGNGFDRWERDSANLCREYLESRMGVEKARTVGELIVKDSDPAGWSLEKRIAHDADCLEIMRITTLVGFIKAELYFLGQPDPEEIRNRPVREALIREAWAFIRAADTRNPELFNSSDPMADVLGILEARKADFPLLGEILS